MGTTGAPAANAGAPPGATAAPPAAQQAQVNRGQGPREETVVLPPADSTTQAAQSDGLPLVVGGLIGAAAGASLI